MCHVGWVFLHNFSELHGTVKHLSANMTVHYLYRRDLSVLFFSIWVLNKMSEVRIQHVELAHDFLDLCLWVPVAGQGSLSSVTDPGYMTWVHYTCEKSLFLGRKGYGLHFVTSALDLLLPSWKWSSLDINIACTGAFCSLHFNLFVINSIHSLFSFCCEKLTLSNQKFYWKRDLVTWTLYPTIWRTKLRSEETQWLNNKKHVQIILKDVFNLTPRDLATDLNFCARRLLGKILFLLWGAMSETEGRSIGFSFVWQLKWKQWWLACKFGLKSMVSLDADES